MEVKEKQCINCGDSFPLSGFRKQVETKDGHTNQCRECLNTLQRERRKRQNNSVTNRYEKTKKGFLVRKYRNMQSRIEGIQKAKYHLYKDRYILERDSFYVWAAMSDEFHRLFKEWEKSGYKMKLTPTVDRIDSTKGYSIQNMEWVTHSENSRRGSVSIYRH